MPMLGVGEVELYYEIHGSGPPLLNISGTGNDLRWSSPETNPLNAHFTVCHYDQRGLGRAVDHRDRPGQPDPDVAYTMADYANDAAALLDHLGWDRVDVVGTSFGGMVAQNLVVAHPQRIRRLVLACTSAGGPGGASVDFRELAELSPEQALVVRGNQLDTRNDLANGVLAPGMDLITKWAKRRNEAPEPDAVAKVQAQRQLDARADHDTWEGLATVIHPTLVIGGRYDGVAPVANMERIAERLPNAQLHWCDGGHIFFLQDPQAWPRVIEFLTSSAG